MPGVPGFWVAAGLSLNGFGGAGGLGRTIAEWITAGETELDVHGYRAVAVRRRVPQPVARSRPPGARCTSTTTGCATRSIPTSGAGPNRTGPLHERLQEQGAVFGAKNGWERARLLPARAAVAASRRGPARVRLDRPPYFDRLAEEHAAFRERVGIIDMTSFGKIEVEGPGALALLERVTDNRIDRRAGQRRLHAVPQHDAAGSSPTSPSPGSPPTGSGS